MHSMKNAALLGLASADRTLFAPVAAPYGQAYEPAFAGAYAMSADAMFPVQVPVEFAQPEPTSGSDSQTWLIAGVGALALVGAAAARSSKPSAVAALDEEDLEFARVAMLGVGGGANQERQKERRKGQGWTLTSFLMQGRRGGAAGNDGTFGELEYLSGAARPASDDPSVLNNRFKMKYDTRERTVKKQKFVRKAQETDSRGAWRSKNQMSSLYK